MSEGIVTREEWRVTGDPGPGYPPYMFVFGSPQRLFGGVGGPHMSTQEWVAGDPLHPVVDGVTRPIVEVLNDHPDPACAAMCEPLRWEGDDS